MNLIFNDAVALVSDRRFQIEPTVFQTTGYITFSEKIDDGRSRRNLGVLIKLLKSGANTVRSKIHRVKKCTARFCGTTQLPKQSCKLRRWNMLKNTVGQRDVHHAARVQI